MPVRWAFVCSLSRRWHAEVWSTFLHDELHGSMCQKGSRKAGRHTWHVVVCMARHSTDHHYDSSLWRRCSISSTFCQLKVKVKADIALHGNPISELRDVTSHMESHSVPATRHKWTRPLITPAMQAGTRFTYPGGMEGWVDLVDLIAPRPGVKPATFQSRVWRRTAAPPRQLIGLPTDDISLSTQRCIRLSGFVDGWSDGVELITRWTRRVIFNFLITLDGFFKKSCLVSAMWLAH